MIRNSESDFVGSALESVAAMRRRDDCFIVDDRAAAQEVVEGDVDDPGPAVRNHVLAVEDPRREVTHRIFLKNSLKKLQNRKILLCRPYLAGFDHLPST